MYGDKDRINKFAPSDEDQKVWEVRPDFTVEHSPPEGELNTNGICLNSATSHVKGATAELTVLEKQRC